MESLVFILNLAALLVLCYFSSKKDDADITERRAKEKRNA